MKSLSLHGGVLYLNCKDKLTENYCLFSSDSGAIPQKRYFQSGHSFSTFNVPKKLNHIPKAATISQHSMSQISAPSLDVSFLLHICEEDINISTFGQLFGKIQPNENFGKVKTFAHLWEHQHININININISVRTSTYQHLDNFPLSSLTIQQNPSFRFAKTLVQATRYN